MNRSRRRVLASAVALLTAGCLSEADRTVTETDRTTGTDSPTPTAETATPQPGAPAYLPPDAKGWERTDSESGTYSRFGANDGTRGYYERDGSELQVLVMRFDSRAGARDQARIQYCQAGWPVVLTDGPFIVAAGTGTPPLTATPERPPTMEATPTADAVETTIALLGHSPELTEEEIREHRFTDADCES